MVRLIKILGLVILTAISIVWWVIKTTIKILLYIYGICVVIGAMGVVWHELCRTDKPRVIPNRRY
jgi:hypothetical protein